ncbi:MAG: homoserine dehydrogenase, partial [Planctomycetes bacterium]|nr:homoserine dehydrogenase [Planctomycetota bacterium]
MKEIRVAILGCGTVGGGVARILLDLEQKLQKRTECKITLATIVTRSPARSSEKFSLPKELFCGSSDTLSDEECSAQMEQVMANPTIDLIVETIGGCSPFLQKIMKQALANGKHLVTANKALLAEHGDPLFSEAEKQGVQLGFEAAICGAIPIVRSITDSFAGDDIESLSGIFNGTSNYILSKMTAEKLPFDVALKLAQDKGYAEADPTLDINGGDAGHKLSLLARLAFGQKLPYDQLEKFGIENITEDDLDFAKELGCVVKMICHATVQEGKISAAVTPMMVKESNFLSKVNGAENAVLVKNKYGGAHILVGQGAGSYETASSIVADIACISRNERANKGSSSAEEGQVSGLSDLLLPYHIIFETANHHGVTGAITTAIGKQSINIDTVGHNRHNESGNAVFAVATLPCSKKDILKA